VSKFLTLSCQNIFESIVEYNWYMMLKAHFDEVLEGKSQCRVLARETRKVLNDQPILTASKIRKCIHNLYLFPVFFDIVRYNDRSITVYIDKWLIALCLDRNIDRSIDKSKLNNIKVSTIENQSCNLILINT